MTEDALTDIMAGYVRDEISALYFVERYQTAWKSWRDSGATGDDLLDRAFTATDCYAPSPKAQWEISDEQLKAEIADLLAQISKRST